MRFLRPEYVPLIVLILAVAQMASFADRGVFELAYSVAELFSFLSLGSGVGIYFYLRNRDATAARVAIATGVLFFVALFAAGEYLFAAYFP